MAGNREVIGASDWNMGILFTDLHALAASNPSLLSVGHQREEA